MREAANIISEIAGVVAMFISAVFLLASEWDHFQNFVQRQKDSPYAIIGISIGIALVIFAHLWRWRDCRKQRKELERKAASFLEYSNKRDKELCDEYQKFQQMKREWELKHQNNANREDKNIPQG